MARALRTRWYAAAASMVALPPLLPSPLQARIIVYSPKYLKGDAKLPKLQPSKRQGEFYLQFRGSVSAPTLDEGRRSRCSCVWHAIRGERMPLLTATHSFRPSARTFTAHPAPAVPGPPGGHGRHRRAPRQHPGAAPLPGPSRILKLHCAGALLLPLPVHPASACLAAARAASRPPWACCLTTHPRFCCALDAGRLLLASHRQLCPLVRVPTALFEPLHITVLCCVPALPSGLLLGVKSFCT